MGGAPSASDTDAGGLLAALGVGEDPEGAVENVGAAGRPVVGIGDDDLGGPAIGRTLTLGEPGGVPMKERGRFSTGDGARMVAISDDPGGVDVGAGGRLAMVGDEEIGGGVVEGEAPRAALKWSLELASDPGMGRGRPV